MNGFKKRIALFLAVIMLISSTFIISFAQEGIDLDSVVSINASSESVVNDPSDSLTEDEYRQWKNSIGIASSAVEFSPFSLDSVTIPKTVGNSYIEYYVDNNGYSIGTTGGNTNLTTDNNKAMTYSHPNGSYSHATIRIDGENTDIDTGSNQFDPDTNTLSTTKIIGDVKIERILSLFPNPITDVEDTIRVAFRITNTGNTNREIGFRTMWDTCLGSSDSAPFRVSGIGAITKELRLSGSDIPSSWLVLDNLANPEMITQGYPKNVEGFPQPDSIEFLKWGNARNVSSAWNYVVDNNATIGDSAVNIYWDPRNIAPGQTLNCVAYYGVGNYVQSKIDDLVVGVDPGVYQLKRQPNGGYTPNSFEMSAFLENSSNNTAISNLKFELRTPNGLTVVDNPIKEVTSLGAKESKSDLKWTVSVDQRSFFPFNTPIHMYLDYSISGGAIQQIDMPILIPEMNVAPPQAPHNLSATPGRRSVSLSWDDPISHNQYDVLKYKVYRNDEEIAELDASTSAVTSYTDYGNGGSDTDPKLGRMMPYTYKVIAYNFREDASNPAIVTTTTLNIADGDPSSVKGKIISTTDSTPVANVIVQLSSDDTDAYRTYTTTTDGQGNYAFTGTNEPWPGTYNITISATEDYRAYSNRITLGIDEELTHDIQIDVIPEIIYTEGPITYAVREGSTNASIRSTTQQASNTEISEALSRIATTYTIKKIEENAFSNTSLSEITIPKTVTFIGANTFSGTSIENIIIPKSASAFGVNNAEGAFSGMTELKNIIIEPGTSTIQNYTFTGIQNNVKVYIPKSVTHITNNSDLGTNTAVYVFANTEAERFAKDHSLSYTTMPTILTEAPQAPIGYKYIPYSFAFESSDGSEITVTHGNLPPGLQISMTDNVKRDKGEIFGAPLEDGNFTVTLRATDGNDYPWVDEVTITIEIKDKQPQRILNNTVNDFIIKKPLGTYDSISDIYVVQEYEGDLIRDAEITFADKDDSTAFCYPTNFIDLWIDGKLQERDVDYTIRAGSTVVTVLSQTFSKLDRDSSHVIAAEFKVNGEQYKVAENFKFNVTKKQNSNDNNNNDNNDSDSSSSSGQKTTSTTNTSTSTNTVSNETITVVNTVTTDNIKKALEKATSGLIKINNKNSVDTKISKEAISELLKKENITLEITNKDITLIFSNEALKEINSQAKGEIEFHAGFASKTSLSEAQKDVVDKNIVADLSVKSNGSLISNFKGDVKVSIAYKPAANMNLNAIVLYYVSSNGSLQIIPNAAYDAPTGRVTFITNHFSLYMVGYNYVSFNDISTHWSKATVEFVAARELVSGVGLGKFDTEKSVSRAEFIQMLQNVLNLPKANTAIQKYNDVQTSAWYYETVMAAKSAGLLKDIATNGNNFMPNQALTREEMGIFLANAVNYKKISVPNKDIDLKKFKDYSHISVNSIDKLKVAMQLGLMSESGVGNGNFNPSGLSTRAQAAQIQRNMLSIFKY